MSLFLAAALTVSDTVRGRVHDNAGNPIAGAEIVLEGIGRLGIADKNGEFILDAPAGATIVFRRPGYQAQARAAADRLDVELSVSPFSVDPIHVTATRAPVSGPASLPISTLNNTQLRREAGVSLAHELSQLSGVRTVSTGEQVGKPVVRGLFGARVLVLEDAIRLEDYSWSDEDAPSIDARFADRVEVVRGPASVLYGSDALGGVVNVIPAPVPQPGSGMQRNGIELSASSNRRESGLVARHEGASASIGWRALLIGRFAMDYQTPEGEVANTGFGAFNGELAAGTQKSWGSITARYARYGGEFKLLEMDAPVSATTEEEGGPVRKLSDDRLQLVGAFPTKRARLETRVQFQRHWLQEVGDLPGQTGQGKEVPVFGLLLNTLSADGFLHHSTGSVGVSMMSQHNDSQGPLLVVPDADVFNAAVSAVERVQTGAFQWSVGARYDHHRVDDLNKNAASYTAGTVAHVRRGVALRANLGRAWRAPNLFELYANGPRIGEGRYEVGDPNLKPERSTEVDAGVDVDTRVFSAEASFYNNRIHDFIALQPSSRFQSGLRVYEHDQIEAELRGLELVTGFRPTHALSINAEYDAVRGKNTANDSPLPWIPAARLQSHVEVSSYTHRYARAGFEHVWSKSRTASNEPTDIGAYTLINAGAGGEARLAGRLLHIEVAARNIGNVAYRDFLNRYREFALNPGRDISFRISMDF